MTKADRDKQNFHFYRIISKLEQIDKLESLMKAYNKSGKDSDYEAVLFQIVHLKDNYNMDDSTIDTILARA